MCTSAPLHPWLHTPCALTLVHAETRVPSPESTGTEKLSNSDKLRMKFDESAVSICTGKDVIRNYYFNVIFWATNEKPRYRCINPLSGDLFRSKHARFDDSLHRVFITSKHFDLDYIYSRSCKCCSVSNGRFMK